MHISDISIYCTVPNFYWARRNAFWGRLTTSDTHDASKEHNSLYHPLKPCLLRQLTFGTGPLGKHRTNREQKGSMLLCLSLSFFFSRSFDHQHQGAVQVFVFPGLDCLGNVFSFLLSSCRSALTQPQGFGKGGGGRGWWENKREKEQKENLNL